MGKRVILAMGPFPVSLRSTVASRMAQDDMVVSGMLHEIKDLHSIAFTCSQGQALAD